MGSSGNPTDTPLSAASSGVFLQCCTTCGPDHPMWCMVLALVVLGAGGDELAPIRNTAIRNTVAKHERLHTVLGSAVSIMHAMGRMHAAAYNGMAAGPSQLHRPHAMLLGMVMLLGYVQQKAIVEQAPGPVSSPSPPPCTCKARRRHAGWCGAQHAASCGRACVLQVGTHMDQMQLLLRSVLQPASAVGSRACPNAREPQRPGGLSREPVPIATHGRCVFEWTAAMARCRASALHGPAANAKSHCRPNHEAGADAGAGVVRRVRPYTWC